MLSTKKGVGVHLTRKQESLVRYLYPKLVTHIEETWKVDSTPEEIEEIEEMKVETLQETRELVHKYEQEIQGISRLTGILKRRYGKELEQLVEELQLGKVTAKELLNLIIKLESNTAIPEEEIKKELIEWVNRGEKYIVKQIEEAERKLVEAKEARMLAEQRVQEEAKTWQEEVKARQAAEQRAKEETTARQEEVKARQAVEQKNASLRKQIEALRAKLDKQQIQSNFADAGDSSDGKELLTSKARKFSRDSSESKRIKIEEKVKKTSQDDLDDALDKKKKPDIG